jgi:methionine-rich copper-binding protein CopC
MVRPIARASLAALIAVAGASPALAHAFLQSAAPAVGSTLATAPNELDCTYTEALEPAFSTLVVRDAAGKRVDAGNMHLAPGDAKQMIVGLRPLPAGTYTVIWHAVSVDTHHTEGHFTFTVAR